MKLDAMRLHGGDEVVDAVVIGTGAGGAPLLAKLAARGLRVVALEAGDNREPGDHTADEAPADRVEHQVQALARKQARQPQNAQLAPGQTTTQLFGAFLAEPRTYGVTLRKRF